MIMIQDERAAALMRPTDVAPLALRRRRLFETSDLEYTRERISNVLQPHDLRPGKSAARSSFRPFYLDHIPVGRIDIGAICFGESDVHVPEIEDYYLFIMCLRGYADVGIDREQYQIDGRHGILIAPGEELRASFSADCEQLFVRVGRQAIADLTGVRRPRFQRDVDLGSARLSPWLLQLATIISDERTISLIDGTPRLADDYERFLVSLLLAGQDHRDADAGTSAIAPASVRHAEAFIHNFYADRMTLASIARAAGVPPRTLLASFRRFRSTSPIRYLRDVRLDAAHRALKEGLADTVTQAATDAGLFHLGRFSYEYTERFGESPSATLRRASFSFQEQ